MKTTEKSGIHASVQTGPTDVFPRDLLNERRRSAWGGVGEVIATSKKIILSSVLAGVIAALLVSFFVIEIYESRATIQIGSGVNLAGQSGPAPAIEPPETLVERLKEVYRREDGAPLPYLKDVRSNRSAKAIVTLTADGETGLQAKKFLTNVVKQLLNEHQAELNRSLSTIEQQIHLLTTQIDGMNKQAETLAARIHQIEKQGLAAAIILTLERRALLDQIAHLKRQQFDLETLRSNSKPSFVVSEPSAPSIPTVPERHVYAIVGGIAGLLIGFVMAVLYEGRKHLKITTDN